jgi:hypothetical protein
MGPKGKGMVINDKEESFINEPKDDKPTDSGSSHKKKDGKKKRRIKKIVYYDDNDESSSQKDDDDDNDYEKKKTVNSNFSFDYSRIPQSSNAHLLSIPLGKCNTRALRNKARCISYMRQEDNIYNNRVYRDKCHKTPEYLLHSGRLITK